jgi:hypothetical protein
MPLIVPGITSEPNSKTEEWQNKLVGKTLSDDQSNETVRPICHITQKPTAAPRLCHLQDEN